MVVLKSTDLFAVLHGICSSPYLCTFQINICNVIHLRAIWFVYDYTLY